MNQVRYSLELWGQLYIFKGIFVFFKALKSVPCLLVNKTDREINRDVNQFTFP